MILEFGWDRLTPCSPNPENMNIQQFKIALVEGDIDFLSKIDRFDVRQTDDHGNNILHYFAKNRNSISTDCVSLVRQLLQLGLDINQIEQKPPHRSALHLAVQGRHKDLVTVLIDCGIDIDSKDENGNSALWQAVMSYNGDDSFFIKYLLKNGANPDLENNHGVSPLSLSETIANYDSRLYFSNDET